MKRHDMILRQLGLKLICCLTILVAFSLSYAQIEVGTAQQLINIRNNLEGNYVQTANIDLRGIENWVPLGNDQTPFTGVYDGGRFVITNLTVNRPDDMSVGLFGVVSGQGAEIRNVGIQAASVSGARPVGGLAGLVTAGAIVKSSYVSGVIRGGGSVGGLIGIISEGARIIDCYAVGQVIAANDAGGLVGGNIGTISNSYAAAIVEGNAEHSGGLCGLRAMGGQVNDSFWDIQISGQLESLGGTGRTTEQMLRADNYPNRIWNFFEVWNIADGRSYPFLRWQGDEPEGHNYPAQGSPGNLIAIPGDRVINLSWTAPPGDEHTGYNIYRNDLRYREVDAETVTFRDENVQNYTQYRYYIRAIWEDETESRHSNIVLATPHEPFAGGRGTEEEPYQIETARQLSDIIYQPNAYYIQVNDINLNVPPWNQGNGWKPVGHYISHNENRPFRGNFNGNGFAIRGMTINAPNEDYLGLFGYINNAELRNITIEDAMILARDNIGALVAKETGLSSIRNCNATGEIEGRDVVGGLIGESSALTITNSSFDGTINGRTRTSGLISSISGAANITGCSVSGSVTGTQQFATGFTSTLPHGALITDSYFDGRLTGATDTGGITGWNSGVIRNTYVRGIIVSGASNVGGIAAQTRSSGLIEYCYVDAHITGNWGVGGIVGNHGGGVITPAPQVVLRNSYARGAVVASNPEGSQNIAGLVGVSRGTIVNCYSTVRVTGPQGQTSGLLHRRDAGTVTGSYWDTQTSGQQTSTGGGTGRLTNQMTFPYDAQTYTGWDFEEIWEHDEEAELNDGYPVLYWQELIVSPNPDIARNPNPGDRATNIPASLERLAWSYTENLAYTNPAGFRVYFNANGEFGEDDDFVWISYVEGQENYSTGEILPEGNLTYLAVYYWKVVPTTQVPDNRNGDDSSGTRSRQQLLTSLRGQNTKRGDAENVPVWRFTTQINPHPTTARNPQPADDAENIAVTLNSLVWTFAAHPVYSNPAGFRVYLNTENEFGDEDEFDWVPFLQHQTNYQSTALLPQELDYAQTYYWKVVPTTINPNRRDGHRTSKQNRRLDTASRDMSVVRRDAENIQVWSFTTVLSNPNPQIAINPDPPHLAVGVSVNLTSVSWEYQPEEHFAQPAGFRVYMNTTGAFGVNAPYVWVDYDEQFERFNSREVLPLPLDANATYFWRVIPTTVEPADRRRKDTATGLTVRGDAEGSPTWRFTTGTVDVGAIQELPTFTELHRNYPNPFNPETTIRFSLAELSTVQIEIFNAQGQRVISLLNKELKPGKHSVVWDGKDASGITVGSGVYFIRMNSTDNVSHSRRMLLIK